VEFFVEDGILAEEALQLIKTEPPKMVSSGPVTSTSGDRDYQLYDNSSQQKNDPFSSYFQSQQVDR